MKWEYQSREYGHTFGSELLLYWELNGDPLTDDYLPEEISAEQLWAKWIDAYAEPVIPIHWSVEAVGHTFEGAPLLPYPYDMGEGFRRDDFLTFFTWPVDPDTGDEVRWQTLPVRTKIWTHDQADKGGFVTTATGWAPSALQPSVNVAALAADAGLAAPNPRTRRYPPNPGVWTPVYADHGT